MVQIGDMTIQDEAVILPAPFAVNFTRDMTAASGNVSYTGFGGIPRALIINTGVNGGVLATFGLAGNNLSGGCIFYQTAGTLQSPAQTSEIINLFDGANQQRADLLSFDNDGFTLTWTKTGTPTGTASILVMALF